MSRLRLLIDWFYNLFCHLRLRLIIYNLFHHLSGCRFNQFLTYFITCQAGSTLVPRNWQGPLLLPRTTCLNTLDGKIFNQITRFEKYHMYHICFFLIHICTMYNTYLYNVYMFSYHRKNIDDVKISFWNDLRGHLCT